MNLKWYTSTLILALTFLSIVGLQQSSDPNQEIVLQFNNEEVSTCEVHAAVAIVKNQLSALGIDGIQIHEQEEGKLRITYFSDIEVAIVKKTLSKKNELISYLTDKGSQENPKSPSEDAPKNYKLDVYEIEKSIDGEFGLAGKYVLELNQTSDRFSNPNVYISIGHIDNYESHTFYKVAYKLQSHIAIAINTISHNIPEVRAGPISSGILNYC